MRFISILISILFFSFAANSQTVASDSVPVRLSTMEARIVNNDARLDWKVVCYLQHAKFEIQRSANGINYAAIHTFEADQARCRQAFEFTDINITGITFYRIKVGDLDGNYNTSRTVALAGKSKDLEINSLTPSVISTNASLSISSAITGKADIIISNFQGTIVKRFSINLNRGIIVLPVSLNDLPAGNYILSISNKFAGSKNIRFTKL